MRTIGFYSFKGGVGRSNLLLNIAYHLAAIKQKNVGVMDLDLEAPGLTVLPCLKPAAVEVDSDQGNYPNKGIRDFLSAATSAMANKKKDAPVPDIARIFYETEMAHNSGGSVHLAPAYPYHLQEKNKIGRENTGAAVFQHLLKKWEGGRPIGAAMFRYIRKRISEADFYVSKLRNAGHRRLDYLLVDLRTGLTELADASVGSLFSELVVVSGLNTQNTDGVLRALRHMGGNLKKAGTVRIRAIPVFSPLPNAELNRVRERLGEIYHKLKDLDNVLKQQGSPLHIVLPASDPRPGKAPDFRTIHYCDYLAVGDGVLVKEYPETLTARELTEIAEDLDQSPDVSMEKTEQAIRETVSSPEKQEPDPLPPDPCWEWIYDYWSHTPDWRWPLTMFGDEKPSEDMLLSRFPEGMANRVREKILTGLAASPGVTKENKLRFISDFNTMEDQQLSSLLDFVAGERGRFSNIDAGSTKAVAIRSLNALRDWMDILETLGFRLISGTRKVGRILEGKANIEGIPEWGMLFLLSGQRMETEATYEAMLNLLKNSDTPLDTAYEALKSLDKEFVADFPVLKDTILDWAEQALQCHMPYAWYNSLGILFVERFGFFAKAEKLFLKATDWDSKRSAFPWNGLGNIFTEHLHRYEEAEKAYRKAIKIDSKYVHPWYGLGTLLAQQSGRYEESEKAFRKALDIDPKFVPAWNGLGVLLSQHLGRYEESEKAYRKAIEINPKFVHAWNWLGNLLVGQYRRYGEAEKAYRKAIEIDPEYVYAWTNLGSFLTKQRGRFEEAERVCHKAIELDALFAVYPYYNLLVQYTAREEWRKIKKLSEEIDNYLDNERELLHRPHLDEYHTLLFALYGKTEALMEMLALLEKRSLDFEDRIFCWVCARLADDESRFTKLPEYSGKDLAAHKMETIIELAAITSRRLNSETEAEFKEWINQTLEKFTQPSGSRPLNVECIAPFIKQLGLSEGKSA